MALEAKVASMHKELDFLRVQLAKKEDAYRAFATDECGVEEEHVVAVIKSFLQAGTSVSECH